MLDIVCPPQFSQSPTMSVEKNSNCLNGGDDGVQHATGSPELKSALDCIIQDLKESYAYDSTLAPACDNGPTTPTKGTDDLFPIDGATIPPIPVVSSLLNGAVDHKSSGLTPTYSALEHDMPNLLSVTVTDIPVFTNADIRSILKGDAVFGDLADQSHFGHRDLTAALPTVDPPAVNGCSSPSKINFVNMAARAPQPDTLKVMGFDFPVHSVDAQPSSEPYVCITDVFRTFFGSYHWDEFKDILHRNDVHPVVSMKKNVRGVPEVFDLIAVKEVERLLLNNQARRDGFVRCTNLKSEEKVIMTNEPQPGELVSGIRTRHSDRSDIAYVEVEGRLMPTITIDCVRFVRLIDFVHIVVLPRQINLTSKHTDYILTVCDLLGIDVYKCSNNQKSRMVVYANSMRSGSLHVVSVEDVQKLADYYKRLVERNGPYKDFKSLLTLLKIEESEHQRAARNAFHSSGAQASTSSARPAGNRGRRPKQRYDDYVVDAAQSTDGQAVEQSRSKRGRKKKLDQAATPVAHKKRLTEEPVAGSSSSCKASAMVGQAKKHWARSEGGASVQVDLTKDYTLGMDQVNSKRANWKNNCDASLCKLYVRSDREQPLPVGVYNHRGYVGPQGLYYSEMLINADAPCIWCSACNSIFSVTVFTLHVHGSRRIATKVYLMLIGGDHLSKRQCEIWKEFREKVTLYGICVLDDHQQRRRRRRQRHSTSALEAVAIAVTKSDMRWAQTTGDRGSASSSSGCCSGGKTGAAGWPSTGQGGGGGGVTEVTMLHAAKMFNRASQNSLPDCRVAMSTEPRQDLESLLINQFHVKKNKRPLMLSAGLFQTFRESALTKWNQI